MEEINLWGINNNILQVLADAVNVDREIDLPNGTTRTKFKSELVNELTDKLEDANALASCDDSHMKGFTHSFGFNYDDFIDDPDTDSTELLRETLIMHINAAIVEAKESQLEGMSPLCPQQSLLCSEHR